MTTARNIAIIALLALGVAFVPGGDRTAETVLAAVGVAFLSAIGYAVYRALRSNETTIWTMTDNQRWVFWGAIGLLVLCLVAIDEAFSSGGTFLVWAAVVGASVFALVRVWMQAREFG